MASFIFLGTILAILIFFIRLIIKAIKKEKTAATVRTLVIIVVAYFVLWIISCFLSSYHVVPLGTDIFFDDWCATITKTERLDLFPGDSIYSNRQFIALHVRMTNHARGIAQKPSEPRIHIIDDKGNSSSFSEVAQSALEKQTGKQIPLNQKLELHQSLETILVFDIPKNAKNPKALIEEGPFITRFLLNEDKDVFSVR